MGESHVQAVYAENQRNVSMLQEIKSVYQEFGYYVYLPSNDEFVNISNDVVLDVFCGINITKRILNDNNELDIEKVTLSDFEDIENAYTYFVQLPEIIPYSAVLPDLEGGGWNGTYNVPTGYKSVVIAATHECLLTPRVDDYADTTYYLSNAALRNFKLACSNHDFDEWLIENLISGILGIAAGAPFLSVAYICITGIDAYVSQQTWNKLDELMNSGKKARIYSRSSSLGVMEWTNNQFSVQNGTYNGWEIHSQVKFSNV